MNTKDKEIDDLIRSWTNPNDERYAMILSAFLLVAAMGLFALLWFV